ncbi:MAG: Flp family type IVb pilin [Vicinamibacterales bacterium]
MHHLGLRFTREDDGQDLIEYALQAGFIALASVAMITNIGAGLTTVYSAINTQIQSAS